MELLSFTVKKVSTVALLHIQSFLKKLTSSVINDFYNSFIHIMFFSGGSEYIS